MEKSQGNRRDHSGRKRDVRREESLGFSPVRGWKEEQELAEDWKRLNSEIGRQARVVSQNPEDSVLKGREESVLLRVQVIPKDDHCFSTVDIINDHGEGGLDDMVVRASLDRAWSSRALHRPL